jgi:hypothetical protein
MTRKEHDGKGLITMHCIVRQNCLTYLLCQMLKSFGPEMLPHDLHISYPLTHFPFAAYKPWSRTEHKLRGLSPRASYADGAAATTHHQTPHN